jgi:hypothetical protein
MVRKRITVSGCDDCRATNQGGNLRARKPALARLRDEDAAGRRPHSGHVPAPLPFPKIGHFQKVKGDLCKNMLTKFQ